jgi:hypothetical protein
VFPIDIHSSDTFPFPDPLLRSNAWIFASGLFNLMPNHLKHNKISFVHLQVLFLKSWSPRMDKQSYGERL